MFSCMKLEKEDVGIQIFKPSIQRMVHVIERIQGLRDSAKKTLNSYVLTILNYIL